MQNTIQRLITWFRVASSFVRWWTAGSFPKRRSGYWVTMKGCEYSDDDDDDGEDEGEYYITKRMVVEDIEIIGKIRALE